MPQLPNQRQEAFAQAVARGNKSISQSYADAGFRPCRQSASRLLTRADVKQRVTEIQSQAQADNKDGRDLRSGQFVMGYNGGPGRPKGSRNRLGEAFISDLHESWLKHGRDVIERVVRDDPSQFLKTCAGLMPREIDQTLSIDADLFRECRNFAAAFRLARDHILADAPLLIESKATDAD
jgi:hypothetical protein